MVARWRQDLRLTRILLGHGSIEGSASTCQHLHKYRDARMCGAVLFNLEAQCNAKTPLGTLRPGKMNHFVNQLKTNCPLRFYQMLSNSKDASCNEGKKKAPTGSTANVDAKKGTSGSSGDEPPEDKPTDTKAMLAGAVSGLLLYVAVDTGQKYATSNEVKQITMQDLLKHFVSQGHVEKFEIVDKNGCWVHLKHDAPGVPVNSSGQKVLWCQFGSSDAFEAKIEEFQRGLGIHFLDFLPVQYVTKPDYVSRYVPSLMVLMYFLISGMALRRFAGIRGAGSSFGQGQGTSGGRNMFNMGKAFSTVAKDLKSKVRFIDVAGQAQAKREVTEFVDFLKDSTKFKVLGAKIPKGGLLVGPPGTGKTLLAKAVAGEAGCPFYSMSGSDFIEMYAGVGPSRVRDLFEQARSTAPSIIFIDEIDAVGRKRGSGRNGGGSDERENTLNQMLVEMDGFSSGTGVVVLAGTNRKDILDPALTRPGRFDRIISIDKPDIHERQEIFLVHLKPLTLANALTPDSAARRMAALTPGFAGADIANVCNEAAIFAARRQSAVVEMTDFELATERVIGGLAKNSNLMGAEQKRTVALHESGHALAGWFLENTEPLLKVSIVPRSNGALGFAQYLPEELALYSREAILDKIAVALAGRAAEELFVGQISTGASDDLDKVTKMAHAMVSVYGMNHQVGLVSYGQLNSQEQYYKPYSEQTGQIIDNEVRALIEQQYIRVKALLVEKEDTLKAFSDKLFEHETLVYKDIVGILGERPFGIKEEYSEFVTADGGLSQHPVKNNKRRVTIEHPGLGNNKEGLDEEIGMPPVPLVLNSRPKAASPSQNAANQR